MILAVLGSVSSNRIHLATQGSTRLKAPIVEMGLTAPSWRKTVLGLLKGKGL